jgi:hypothetical protein
MTVYSSWDQTLWQLRKIGCVVFDRVRDRAGINHDFLSKSLDFWLFDFYVYFGFIISFNFASHGATLRSKLYSCFKLHIERSLLLSSCSLSLCICVNINYTFEHENLQIYAITYSKM